MAIAFDKPAVVPDRLALVALRSMQDRGMPVGKFIGDRNYAPAQKAEKFQIPIRQMGYGIVCDYKIDQLGIQRQHRGAIQVEGTWYCPSMPEPLINATIDHRADRTDADTYHARIEGRRRYQLRPKEHADTNGSQPLMCPAVGARATAACPLKPTSMLGKNLVTRARINPPAKPDAICTNTTSVSFPIDAGAKYAQDFPYGGEDWLKWYGMRSAIEGFNAYIKDTNYEAAGAADRRRIRGLPAQHLFLAINVLAANIRKIRTWDLRPQVNPQLRITRRQKQTDAKSAQATTRPARANSPPIAA